MNAENEATRVSVDSGSRAHKAGTLAAEGGVLVDCGRCVSRGLACSDCVINVLVAAPRPVEWDETELRAIEALSEAGLIPKLRLKPADISRREAA